MPKSKRAKVVHLSKLGKKGKELSVKTFTKVQENVAKYPYIYVVAIDNMRNNHLKDVRGQLSDSSLLFGKTKVMAKALGHDDATAPAPGTHHLARHLTGSVGLLFSPRQPDAVADYFATFRPFDYARAGAVATRDFTLPAGVLHTMGGGIPQEEDVPVAHSVEPNLRNLGVPTRLVKGKVMLENEHAVCKEGEVLGSGQTTLLKMFGVAMVEFQMSIRAYWVAESGEVTVVDGSATSSGDEEEMRE